MTWIQSWTGQAVDLLEPDPRTLRIEDIAHALSLITRYTGHTDTLYSVAQHSVLVSDQVGPPWELEGLMHDAPEAYLNDVSAPAKMAMRELMHSAITAIVGHHAWPGYDQPVRTPYGELEERMWRAVAQRFGLADEIPPPVLTADKRMLLTEKRMLGKEPKPWGVKGEPYPIKIEPWSAKHAERTFLHRFKELTAQRDRAKGNQP